MPFVIAETTVVGEVSLAPSAVLYDGAVTADGDLTVKVNSFYYAMGTVYGKYAGSVGNAVTDNTTNYAYLNSSGGLVINAVGYPGAGLHIRLARIVASGGFVTRVILERAFLAATAGQYGDDVFVFATGGIGTSPTARYIPFGFTPRNAPALPVSLRAPRAGTASNLRVKHNQGGTGGNLTYTLLVNGAPSALTVTCTAGGVGGADLVNSVVVAADDVLDLRVTKAATIAVSPLDITVTVEFSA